jgi:hypothetical protein
VNRRHVAPALIGPADRRDRRRSRLPTLGPSAPQGYGDLPVLGEIRDDLLGDDLG